MLTQILWDESEGGTVAEMCQAVEVLTGTLIAR
jgi:hypothetical protein